MRDLILVEQIPNTRSQGNIVLLHNYRARKSPRLTMAAKPDYWAGRVLAIGPDNGHLELEVGQEILVFTFAEQTGDRPEDQDEKSPRRVLEKLYTGIFIARGQCFIRPDDIVCVLERAPGEALPPPTSTEVDQDPSQTWARRSCSRVR